MKEEGFATAVQPAVQEASAPVVPKEYRLYFGLLVTCFALWGLLNNMTDNLVPSFAKIFMIKAVDSSLVQVAFYGAYAVLALPAAFIIKRYSYRVGVLVGLGFYMVGAFGYIPRPSCRAIIYSSCQSSSWLAACRSSRRPVILLFSLSAMSPRVSAA